MKYDKGTICLEKNNIEGLEILSYVPIYMYNELSQVHCINQKEECISIQRVDTYKIYRYILDQSYECQGIVIYSHCLYNLIPTILNVSCFFYKALK